ncbi:flagellar motor switch phosphatase FliY [Ornithinibacillus halophilus]|uniref:Flagellar motor switch protein FliN/FliY n=1 Tax=Ornithinibacillus halophilus TaxID=930117 RepID=A0A1M5CB30_9BACI|nr:flagellar motor switch phosphatase FliY [Ornithinibacillus halophilus]SHF51797.1 flagellar motor switch protein FliN/FliY [Ornithinibacillus halophilus]
MTNDGMLSQDEIDALLSIGEEEEEELTLNTNNESMNELSGVEIDTLGEIGNISFGSSATTLSTLLNQKVEITTPTVSVINQNALDETFDFDHVSVQVNYVEGFTGHNIFVIKSDDAAIISEIMLGGDGTGKVEELNEIHLSAVQEAMNQMMGAAATSMSTVFNKRVDISPPSITFNKSSEPFKEVNDKKLVKVSFQLKVGTLIDSNIMQLIPIDFAKELVEHLMHDSTEEVAAAVQEMEAPQQKEEIVFPEITEEKSTKVEQETPQFIGTATKQESDIQTAQFSNFEPVAIDSNNQRNLDMLLDIPLKITVELGRTKRTIKDILDLSSGSIVELDKLAGEPVDVLVNDKLIAKGEVVVIDENFGVRVTDIISQSDRLMKLK